MNKNQRIKTKNYREEDGSSKLKQDYHTAAHPRDAEQQMKSEAC
jgi:hypothetical protein